MCDTIRPTIGAAKSAKLEGLLYQITRLKSLVLDDVDWFMFEDLVTKVVEMLPAPQGIYARDVRLQLGHLVSTLRGETYPVCGDSKHEFVPC